MITLPTERKKAENYNPSLLVLFGKPKSGKSTLMAALDSNLIIDLENGYRALSVMDVQVRTAEELFQVKAMIEAQMQKTGTFPYRFITIDNATRLEEMSLPYAAHLYRSTAMGQGWGKIKDLKTGKSEIDPKADVRLLPNGAGYLYLRQAIRKMIDMFKPLCETLILVAHVKDKQIKKNGEEMSEMSIIKATEAYVSGFNGDYKYMRLLQYFIWKEEIKDGSKVPISELANYIENAGQEDQKDWEITLR